MEVGKSWGHLDYVVREQNTAVTSSKFACPIQIVWPLFVM